MSFTWPAALLLGLAVPLVLGTYLLAARRRRRHAVTYSSLALLRKALPRRSRWRRHVPVALLLTSLAVLAVAAARPQLTSDVPVSKTTIILALDESGSMCLTDVLPNRLTVAQHAAREFVDAQPKGAANGPRALRRLRRAGGPTDDGPKARWTKLSTTSAPAPGPPSARRS